MNMLYEKLANKIREEFVLTTDDQEIIERNSTATFDEFLRVYSKLNANFPSNY